jgi:transposase
MDPIAAKTYPGEEWKMGPNRATFEPATGQPAVIMSPSPDSTSHIQLLEKIVIEFPAERWLIIEDILSTHISQQTRLALMAWPEIQIQLLPKYVCWLNLIEWWFKQLRSLGLKGRRFETLDELIRALNGASDYWNDCHPYRWKMPQELVTILGGFGVIHNTSCIERENQ